MRTPNEIYDNELDLLGVTSMNEFDEAYLEFISEIQKEAWNEAIDTVIENINLIPIDRIPTGMITAEDGSFRYPDYSYSIDTESILKLKK